MSPYRKEVLSGSPQMAARIPDQPPGGLGGAPSPGQRPQAQPAGPQGPGQQYPGPGPVPPARKKFPVWIAAVVVVVIAAAVLVPRLLGGGSGGGNGLSGVYASGPNHSITFNTDGTADLSYSGVKMTFDYKVSGREVTFTPQDDSLQGMYAQMAEIFGEGGVIGDDGSITVRGETFTNPDAPAPAQSRASSKSEEPAKADEEAPREDAPQPADAGGGATGTAFADPDAPGELPKAGDVFAHPNGNFIEFLDKTDASAGGLPVCLIHINGMEAEFAYQLYNDDTRGDYIGTVPNGNIGRDDAYEEVRDYAYTAIMIRREGLIFASKNSIKERQYFFRQ